MALFLILTIRLAVLLPPVFELLGAALLLGSRVSVNIHVARCA